MWILKFVPFIFLIFDQIDGQFKDFQYIKVKRFKCTSDFKHTFENLTCFAKPINRNQTALTSDIWFKKPFNFMNVSSKSSLI